MHEIRDARLLLQAQEKVDERRYSKGKNRFRFNTFNVIYIVKCETNVTAATETTTRTAGVAILDSMYSR
ncbi:hypothetical protein [Bradyrhizobium sp. NBAIM01]|uniref:hypothetical protein n=1 Tax=Bradyrhizobium sp. NBAIM01 TaxID=2793818 RepID=UPI001CD1E1C0|nr:hypothetical protein [Bradyrhizobium sp. NBAIM01]MCA1515052.1 hypothetical protein [Bradyrhizobium sp. NBAIM01]